MSTEFSNNQTQNSVSDEAFTSELCEVPSRVLLFIELNIKLFKIIPQLATFLGYYARQGRFRASNLLKAEPKWEVRDLRAESNS